MMRHWHLSGPMWRYSALIDCRKNLAAYLLSPSPVISLAHISVRASLLPRFARSSKKPARLHKATVKSTESSTHLNFSSPMARSTCTAIAHQRLVLENVLRLMSVAMSSWQSSSSSSSSSSFPSSSASCISCCSLGLLLLHAHVDPAIPGQARDVSCTQLFRHGW